MVVPHPASNNLLAVFKLGPSDQELPSYSSTSAVFVPGASVLPPAPKDAVDVPIPAM